MITDKMKFESHRRALIMGVRRSNFSLIKTCLPVLINTDSDKLENDLFRLVIEDCWPYALEFFDVKRRRSSTENDKEKNAILADFIGKITIMNKSQDAYWLSALSSVINNPALFDHPEWKSVVSKNEDDLRRDVIEKVKTISGYADSVKAEMIHYVTKTFSSRLGAVCLQLIAMRGVPSKKEFDFCYADKCGLVVKGAQLIEERRQAKALDEYPWYVWAGVKEVARKAEEMMATYYSKTHTGFPKGLEGVSWMLDVLEFRTPKRALEFNIRDLGDVPPKWYHSLWRVPAIMKFVPKEKIMLYKKDWVRTARIAYEWAVKHV